MIPSFRKIRTMDAALRLVQESIDLCLSQIISKEILNGVLVKDVVLASGINLVEHKLGKKPNGFIIVARNANESVWNAVSTKQVDNLNIALEASGAVTVSIWFF